MPISAVKFRAICLKLIDRVAKIGEPVVITKRGKVLGGSSRIVAGHSTSIPRLSCPEPEQLLDRVASLCRSP